MKRIPWDGSSWHAPRFPGSNEADEGSPFVHWYVFDDGEKGFLICWPEGYRLRFQTHKNGEAVAVDHAWVWWLDPAWRVETVPDEKVA